MEIAFSRHSATTRVISGVYENAYAGDPEYKNLQARIQDMEQRPHVLVAKVGQDGHDRGAKVIATALLILVLLSIYQICSKLLKKLLIKLLN